MKKSTVSLRNDGFLRGRRYNSLPEWYGGGAVPPILASMGNSRRYSALAVPLKRDLNSALAVPLKRELPNQKHELWLSLHVFVKDINDVVEQVDAISGWV